MSRESPDNQGANGERRSWWRRLQRWWDAAFEPPGQLTRRIDDPPDWSPDNRGDAEL